MSGPTNIPQALLLQRQILRLAKIYQSRPVSPGNIDWHHRVLTLQVGKIKERKAITKTTTPWT